MPPSANTKGRYRTALNLLREFLNLALGYICLTVFYHTEVSPHTKLSRELHHTVEHSQHHIQTIRCHPVLYFAFERIKTMHTQNSLNMVIPTFVTLGDKVDELHLAHSSLDNICTYPV